MTQKDPIIKLYFDLIEKNTPVFKAYYYGDPIRVPSSSMPVICASRRMTTVSYGDNANDEHAMQIVFTIIADVRKDIADDKQMVPGWDMIFDIVEGRDPKTLLLKPDSLLSILRHNFGIANNLWTDVRTVTKVDYGLVANKRAPGSWSIEAAVTLTCTLVQLR